MVLSFDCFGDNATVAIMTDQALRQGSTEVRLSVDSAPPRKIKGFAGTTSTGGKVLLTIAQDSLLAWLTGHRRAIVNYADGAGSSKTTGGVPHRRARTAQGAVPGGVCQARGEALGKLTSASDRRAGCRRLKAPAHGDLQKRR